MQEILKLFRILLSSAGSLRSDKNLESITTKPSTDISQV